MTKKSDNVWESKNWINHVKESLKKSLTEPPCINKLAVINSCKIVCRMTDYKKIHVIDFGGGCGVLVSSLLSSLQNEKKPMNIIDSHKSEQTATILNLSRVLQYIPKYEIFLGSLLRETNPMFVCITRFEVCENTNTDAFTFQNVITSKGFAGSIIVNLFGKNSLTKLMDKLGYRILFDDTHDKSIINYFDKCDDEKYRNMSMNAYIFLKN